MSEGQDMPTVHTLILCLTLCGGCCVVDRIGITAAREAVGCHDH